MILRDAHANYIPKRYVFVRDILECIYRLKPVFYSTIIKVCLKQWFSPSYIIFGTRIIKEESFSWCKFDNG